MSYITKNQNKVRIAYRWVNNEKLLEKHGNSQSAVKENPKIRNYS